jgi:phosphoglycolate phosphatase-like HAD superfamily hydrolase
MAKTVHPDVLVQLEALTLDEAMPLVISDADEVLVEFMVALEIFLERNGMYFDWSSFALSGNIRRRDDESPVDHEEVKSHLEDFFAAHAHQMTPVPGAAEALAGLSERSQIVILSNVPLQQLEARRRSLAEHGMDYPVIANIGSKGAPVRNLAERVRAPVFFLDDIPRNHTSVALAAEHVLRLHFVADPRLADMLGPAEDSHYRVDDWSSARAIIERLLDEHGF